MNTSTYYGLNLAEGSDIVNPLIIDVPNYEKIDEVMHDNAVAGVGTATELLTGTVHALVRDNDETAIFRFVATANFTAGDTFTVDGVQVTALLPSGESLGSGAYVINANVLCILTGTLLTMYVPSGAIAVAEDSNKLGGELPSYYGTASDVNQANLVAQAAGQLANQVSSEVTQLQTLDFSETSIQPGTSFNSVVQQLMNKVFAKIKTVATYINVSTGPSGVFVPTTVDSEYFTNSNGVLTCKVDGTYRVYCEAISSPVTYLWVHKNGSEFIAGRPTPGDFVDVPLSVGNTLALRNTAGTISATTTAKIELRPN